MTKDVQHFFDKDTSTLTYVVSDPASKDAVVIDPVLDYDPASSAYSEDSVIQVENYIREHNFNIHLIMDTHAHADHISGMQALKKRFPEAKTVIGKNISKVQSVFKDVFHLTDLNVTGADFDILADEDSPLNAGSIEIETLFTPGHTPACASYLIDNMLFTGDALFMPDFGTGRCDFPAGSAEDLYTSVHDKIYQLPDETRVFTGHDYQPNGRDLLFESTIAEQKKHNIHIKSATPKEEFVAFRTERDKQLKAPRLLLPSIQINIRGAEFPEPEANGTSYLKLPLRKA